MVLCFVIKYALQNRKLNIITGPNAEHCSKRDAAPQHQKIDLVYSAYIGQYALPTLSMYGIIKLSSSLLPLLLMRKL